jgi:hypothetical protein
MATVRERRPGVWEVRGYTGRDREGNPTHADPAMTLRVYAHAVERSDEALAQILGEALD